MEITSGKIKKAQKVVVYGPEGIGKSTFAAQFPRPVFDDTEGSTTHMDVNRTPFSSSWTMLLEHIQYFVKNPTLLDTYIIDTADWAERLCLSQICSKTDKKGIEDFGYGKGYVYLYEEFGRMLNLLQDLIDVGVNVVITAHAKLKKIEQPDEMGSYDHWELKLEKQTAPLLKEWADMLLFVNYKTFVINVDGQGAEKGKNKAQGGSRVMYTTHSTSWDAKNRQGLKPELKFEYSEIAHVIPSKNSIIPATPVVAAVSVPGAVIAAAATDRLNTTTTYWHHAEKNSAFMVKAGEQIPSVEGPGLLEEIDEAEYVRLLKAYANAASNAPTIAPPTSIPGVPKALSDLMIENKVTELEIQEAVASKGYYPKATQINKYDANFINGVLVGAWAQVFKMIQDSRELPFK